MQKDAAGCARLGDNSMKLPVGETGDDVLAANCGEREGSGRGENDRIFHPAVPADHPDVHRDHWPSSSMRAVRAGGPVGTSIVRYQMAAMTGGSASASISGQGSNARRKNRSRRSAATTASTKPVYVIRKVAVERRASRSRHVLHLPGSGGT